MTIYPKAYLKNVREITIDFLKQNNIEALILDVDNTLIDYNKNLSDEVIKWALNLQGQGIKIYILSNSNKHEKVKNVADKINAPYINFAKKAFKKGFLKVRENLKIEEKRIAVVGDQIFTDVIGGNRCKMYTILVDPIIQKDFWFTAWKRPIEDKIKSKIKKENKGEK